MIRKAAFSDCGNIAHVQVDSYRSAYASLMPAEYLAVFSYEEQERDWNEFLKAGEGLLLVAEEQGQVIGYACSHQLFGKDHPFDCEMDALHVNRDFQHRGAGRALIAETARRMHALGCRSLGLFVLDGNPATGFYERLGGQPYGEQFFEMQEFILRRREVGYRWERIEDLFLP